jgi:hypothetical protein
MSQLMLDRAGRRRSPATLPGFGVGQAPGNKGHRSPADPPRIEETSRSCVRRETGRTVGGCVRSW